MITARSLEVFAQLGLVEPIVDCGVHIWELVVAVDETLFDAAVAGHACPPADTSRHGSTARMSTRLRNRSPASSP